MAENFQSAPFFGKECALQPSVPGLRNAMTLAGSVCNFSRVSTRAVSAAWLLPSDSNTCCQQLMDSAYPYLPVGTTMVTVLTDQGQITASPLSYPGVLQCGPMGNTDQRGAALQDLTVTVIDQNTTFSSFSGTAQSDNILDPNALFLSYPTLSASFFQATPPQVPNQGYSLAPSYLEESQVYYNEFNSLGPLMPGELGQCLQACGSVSYSGGQASALQPEMVMMPKEIQSTNVQTPFSTSAKYYATPAQDKPDTILQVAKMETTLGLTAAVQTYCLLQSPDLWNASMQDVQKSLPVHGDWSLTAPMDSPSEFLPLTPAPILEQTENNNLDLMTHDLSTPLDAYEGIKENQDPSLLPLAHANMQQALNYTDSGSLKQKLSPDNATLGSSSLSQDEPGVLQSVMGSSMDFADMTTLVADIHLPRLFNSITDMNPLQDPTATQSKDISRDQVQETSSTISVPVDQVRKDGQKASEMLDVSPQARIQLQDLEEEEAVGSAGSSEGAIENMPKNSEDKAQNATPSMPSRARAPGQDKTKRSRENNCKKTEELKQSRNRVKADENTTMPKNKRKRNPPELSHNSFKKPRTHLGMHMLESVQVFHPLGKKSEKKTGISSSRARPNFRSNKDPRTGPATTSLLDVPCNGRGPGKTPSNAQRTERNDYRNGRPSPSQYKLPPPGKVKLVPLAFPALDMPQARPISTKPLSLASHRAPALYPVRPHSNSAHSTTLKPSKPAPASTSLMASDKPVLPIATSATRDNITNPIQSCTGPQTAVCRPVSYRASSHPSLQRQLASADKNKAPSPPKPQIQHLLQDFSHQPIPWRNVHIPGPVISQPITEEQRPERETMKRRAQQERENAAKYNSLGKPQLFLQRQKDMDISRYFGYVM
ncbi:uncharacterized protein C2orf78 homolog [Peromyscus maniculatus bairdii]|uniref:uncharacterized protein C2orf78 homolog n=1 Tax=Peromyscus maniculatus bairdii TaxID=230844 RepID=UPI003FCF2654